MVENLGIVGISWRQTDSEALEDFSLSGNSIGERLALFAKRAELSELAYLETCNRVEIIFSNNQETTHDFRPLVYEFVTGRPAKSGEA